MEGKNGSRDRKMSSTIRVPISTLCRYPFLEAAKEWMKKREISPLDALGEHPEILDNIRIIFEDALENKE
ncbi:MAG: hypothetical protein ACTSUE_05735, partial [Promethearchaeota archaeon]